MTDHWSHARNILCVRLDSLGDVLMTTPAMRALKESASGRRVTLLTSRSGDAAAALVPDVDDTIVYEAPWMKHGTRRDDVSEDMQLIGRLRAGQFDAAVIFTVFSQNPLPAALLCYLAEIPLRLAHCRENPYRLLTDWVAEPEPHERVRHETRRQLDLVATVGARTGDERLRLSVPASARKRVQSLLAREGLVDERPWAVVHPGATAASRRYPPGHFAEVARRLGLEHGWRIVYTGDDCEKELVTAIERESGIDSVCLAGRLEFAELAALIEAAPLVIANNTGPVHVAAAVGTPVVDLYALTNPQHTPWLVPHRVLSHDVPCKYCYKSVCPLEHHDCLRRIAPTDVVSAALELREEVARPSSALI
jgi:lipopolysaccharide heptosyltransferase II